ncbi:hypothetical protein OG21DRAFT_1527195 [Imleria badia]|nr:hypothetical protein OG21DRAFT_1527195 [Imleria badia]
MCLPLYAVNTQRNFTTPAPSLLKKIFNGIVHPMSFLISFLTNACPVFLPACTKKSPNNPGSRISSPPLHLRWAWHTAAQPGNTHLLEGDGQITSSSSLVRQEGRGLQTVNVFIQATMEERTAEDEDDTDEDVPVGLVMEVLQIDEEVEQRQAVTEMVSVCIQGCQKEQEDDNTGDGAMSQ